MTDIDRYNCIKILNIFFHLLLRLARAWVTEGALEDGVKRQKTNVLEELDLSVAVRPFILYTRDKLLKSDHHDSL